MIENERNAAGAAENFSTFLQQFHLLLEDGARFTRRRLRIAVQYRAMEKICAKVLRTEIGIQKKYEFLCVQFR